MPGSAKGQAFAHSGWFSSFTQWSLSLAQSQDHWARTLETQVPYWYTGLNLSRLSFLSRTSARSFLSLKVYESMIYCISLIRQHQEQGFPTNIQYTGRASRNCILPQKMQENQLKKRYQNSEWFWETSLIYSAYLTTNEKSYTNIKKCKTPRNKLPWKHAQDLHEKKFKMLMRDTEKYLNKWKHTLHLGQENLTK